MATLERIRTYPIKSLDAWDRDRATVVGGAIDHDRTWAMVDADGAYVNGKRTPRVHRLRARYHVPTIPVTPERSPTVTLRETGSAVGRRFHPDDDRADLEAYLSSVFDPDVRIRRNRDGGQPDDTDASGPTLLSTATLREVASWFDGIDADGMRRRLRPNLEVGGVPAFWEDRLYGDPGEVVAFRVGDLTVHGVGPCQRCVVPTRDPDTGEETPGFRERFVTKRRETRPEWTAGPRYDHDFQVMLNTRVPASEWGTAVAVGDPVEIIGTWPE